MKTLTPAPCFVAIDALYRGKEKVRQIVECADYTYSSLNTRISSLTLFLEPFKVFEDLVNLLLGDQ